MGAVVIIGAGAAGLAAARDLAKAGRDVIVLEARERIGGRIHTIRNDGLPMELGAEFVHGKSPAIWDLAKADHLKLHPVGERHWYFEDGKLTKSRAFWKAVDDLMDRMKSVDTDISFADFLQTLPEDEATHRARDMARRYVEGFHAADITKAGIKGLVKANEAADSIAGDQSFRLENGYASLAEALRAEAESYGATFHLGCRVKEIRWQDKQVQLIAEGSDAREASAVIITVPLSLLQRPDAEAGIKFAPELPKSKREAIQNLTMGNVLRINLEFRERFWEKVKLWDEDGDVLSFRNAGFFHYPDAPLPTWWTQMPLRSPILVGWAGGPRTEIIRQNGELLDQAITSLAAIFNIPATDIRRHLDSWHCHDWQNDPFSLGAYSYVPVDGLASQAILAQPVAGKLFFAGEATCVGHVGTVHGALQTGQRAAQEILSAGG